MSVFCWDFDGTLVSSPHLWSYSVHEALLDTVPESTVTFPEVRAQMATGFTWHTPENDYTHLTGEKWWEFMNEAIFERYLNLGLDRAQAHMATAKVRKIIKRTNNYKLFDGAKEILQAAADAGHKNILLSNNYPDLTDVLDALELTPFFYETVISAIVGYDKPRREIFDYAKRLFPDETVYFMIGDNPKADILGGKTAGMTTVLVHKGFDSAADYCFDDLREINKLI